MRGIELVGVGPALFDTERKLRLRIDGSSGLAPNVGHLSLTYDPLIDVDNLAVPKSPENRARFLERPDLAHLAAEPDYFVSPASELITSFRCRWDQSGQTLCYSVLDDLEAVLLHEKVIERCAPETANWDARQVIRTALLSLPAFQKFKNTDFSSERFSSVDRYEINAAEDVLDHLGVPGSQRTGTIPRRGQVFRVSEA